MNHTSLPVSGLEPHHKVSVNYPALELLEDGEHFLPTLPSKIGERYDPLPIVPDLQVKLHTGAPPTDFTSLYPASQSDTPQPNEVEGSYLEFDMRWCTSQIGSTTLDLVSVQSQSGRYTRLRRTTKLGKSEKAHQFTYHLPKSYWEELIQYPTDELTLWQQDCVCLIRQMSDRAVRHLQERVEVAYELLPRTWKPHRTISLDQGISLLATVVTKDELDRSNDTLSDDDKVTDCRTCWREFADAETPDPVLLPCFKRHIFCYECVERLIQLEGLDKVRCPYCRDNMLTPETADMLQPNYLNIHADYSYDPQFSAYENFERSCADLDWHEMSEKTTVVNLDGFMNAWSYLVDRAPTPKDDCDHLKFTKAPEYLIVFNIIQETVMRENGKAHSAADLHRLLVDNVYSALAQGSSNGTEQHMLWHGLYSRNEALLSYEFAEFLLRKALRRVIQFQEHRRCQDSACGTAGYHKHGYRLFWAPH